MAKLHGAAYAERNSAEFSDAATSTFQHLGEASRRLMELQAQAAAIVLMDSAVRCAEAWDGAWRSLGWQRWTRSQIRSAVDPFAAWVEAATGLQAVMAAAFLQTAALMAFPDAAPRKIDAPRIPERRFDSVVIPFPDRRRGLRG
jgi:hypothetical protein